MVPGTRGPDGECIPNEDPNAPDCTVITQENAEECGADLGNLVDCGTTVTYDVAQPDDEDGNSVPPITVEKSVYARSLEDCEDNTKTLVDCGGGIFANSIEDCPDLEGTGSCDDVATAKVISKEDAERCEIDLTSRVDCGDGTYALTEEDCGEQPDEDDPFQELYDEYGKDIVDKARGLYDKIKDKVGECSDPDNALDCVKDFLDVIYPTLSPECREPGGPTDEWYRNLSLIHI